MIKWFAMLDNDETIYLGEYEDFNAADYVAPGNTVWIWDQESFLDHNTDVQAAIMDARIF